MQEQYKRNIFLFFSDLWEIGSYACQKMVFHFLTASTALELRKENPGTLQSCLLGQGLWGPKQSLGALTVLKWSKATTGFLKTIKANTNRKTYS